MEATKAVDADAVPLGAVDVLNRQPRAPQSTSGPMVTAITAAKNAHTLLMYTIRKRSLHT